MKNLLILVLILYGLFPFVECLEHPSNLPSRCTHHPKYNEDVTQVAFCKTKEYKGECTINDCVWNPGYFVKNNGGCGAGWDTFKIKTLNDKKYSADECDHLCHEEAGDACKFFQLGNKGYKSEGECTLFKDGCT